MSDAPHPHRELQIVPAGLGRALLLQPDGTVYIGRGYDIYRGRTGDDGWEFVTAMPRRLSRRLAGLSRLASRLARLEVRAMGVLSDGSFVATNREWVYHAKPGEPLMRRSQVEEAGQKLYPPLTMTVGPGDRVLWGEYDSRDIRDKAVRVYVSDDKGRSYTIARVFEGGTILHVHNLVFDAALKKYWLLAGDHDHEPGIGLLSEDLASFDWVAKGKQEYRAVEVFDFGDRLIYGMDSERAPNAVISFEKATGRVERGTELDGSCIYACRCGGLYALTTTVEPSAVNRSREAGLWVSRDCDQWRRVYYAEKDRWGHQYFQYGSLVLPRGASNRKDIVVSGQAVRGMDGRVFKLIGCAGGPSLFGS